MYVKPNGSTFFEDKNIKLDGSLKGKQRLFFNQYYNKRGNDDLFFSYIRSMVLAHSIKIDIYKKIINNNKLCIKWHNDISFKVKTLLNISFSVALINVFKYKKFNSPVVAAVKIISLRVACVSMVTLTSSTFYVFSSSISSQNKIILTVVSLFIIIMAIHMITNGIKKLSLITKGDRE